MRHRITAFGVAYAFLICCVLMVGVMGAFSGCASLQKWYGDYEPPPEFAWDGELNPNTFDNWEILSIQHTTNPSITFNIISNPDKTSSIKKVVLDIVVFDGTLLGYRYFKDGQPYLYFFDGESKYIQHKLTLEERKGCMECHQDQIIPEEAV